MENGNKKLSKVPKVGIAVFVLIFLVVSAAMVDLITSPAESLAEPSIAKASSTQEKHERLQELTNQNAELERIYSRKREIYLELQYLYQEEPTLEQQNQINLLLKENEELTKNAQDALEGL